MTRLRLAAAVVVALAALAGGCGGSKPAPPPPPARIVATFAAAADLNPNLSGRPSPIAVRLYELKSPGAFQAGGFRALYDQPEAALAGELTASDELFLQPGESRRIQRTLDPQTRHLGLLAAYRDLDNAQWRALVTVPPNRTTAVTITLSRSAIGAAAAGN
ncbi:MAG: type VI secretion system lipoprotein TssJ [Pseudomonadota bacterium]|nr:type VI secretion system lipoprotein TssJ [Pseudomonadota bacterium]